MKLAIIAAAAALLLAAPFALAADDHKDKHGGEAPRIATPQVHASPITRGTRGGAGATARTSLHLRNTTTTSHTTVSPAISNATTHSRRHGGNGVTTTTASPAATRGNAAANRGVRGGNPQSNQTRGNASGSQRGNAHVTVNFNRRNVTASHHYHYRGGAYHGPSGYSYRRWTFGMTLPSIYWANNYWIDDYYDYGLAPPPPGCVWVRYGDDAVLIDESSGEILEVVYDQFD